MRRFVALALVVSVAACSKESGTIRIGAAGPWHTGYGGNNKKGIDLAIEEINAAGGVDGQRVELVAQNDSANGERASGIADEFIKDHGILAVVGHVNSGTMVSAARVYDGKLAAVATTASSPELSGISSWTFRVIPSDSVNAIGIAQWAQATGHKRAVIYYENDSYGRGLTDSFRRNFKGEIITYDPIASGDANVEPYVAFVQRTKPDLVFVAGTDASGAALLREARKQQVQADFLGADGWTPLVKEPAAEGALVGAPFSERDPRPETQTFVNAFQAKYHELPDGNAALAYDATKLIVEAIRASHARSVGDRKKVRDQLANMTYNGVTGSIKFGSNGDPADKKVIMTRVQNGGLAVVEAK